jgi:hypothetical protein
LTKYCDLGGALHPRAVGVPDEGIGYQVAIKSVQNSGQRF